jgi:hypothetical protein
MGALEFREDADAVRARLSAWWQGEDLGRPVMQVYVPLPEPRSPMAFRPAPPGWGGQYDTADLDYRVWLAQWNSATRLFLGEAMPTAAPDLGPGCLAAYLGCPVHAQDDTAWFAPCMNGRESVDFKALPDTEAWRVTLELGQRLREVARGRFILEFPDMLGGLDTLAAMRDPQTLLLDLLEDPGWAHDCMAPITRFFFECYDICYDLLKDETGGSSWWIWAPGRMAKFQCDFAAMIGPDTFGEFMVPVLREMCGRVDHNLFHWDGPGALPHLDHLLSIDGIQVIQWVPGTGNPFPDAPAWWPIYGRILDAGKGIYVHHCRDLDSLRALKKHFGRDLNRFAIIMGASTREDGEALLAEAEIA